MNPTKIGPFQYGPLTLRIDYMPGQMRLGHEVRYPYGSIPGTAGADGDALDVFLGPNPSAPGVTIIDQIDPATGEVDEHKIGLGWTTADEALAAYRAQWGEGRDAGCVTLPMDDFAAWVDGEGVASAEPFDLLWADFDSRAPLALRKGAFWRAWCGVSKSRRDAITKGPDSHAPPADVRAAAKREFAKLEKGQPMNYADTFLKGAGILIDAAPAPSPARDLALRHVAAAFRALQLWGHGAHLVAKGVGFVGDHVTLLSDLYEFGEHSFDVISERAIGLGAPDAFAEPLGVTTDAVKCLSAWPSVCCDESTLMANAAQVLADAGTVLATQTKVIETTGEMTRGLDNLLAQLADDLESLGYKFGQRNKTDAPALNLRADIATAFGLAG